MALVAWSTTLVGCGGSTASHEGVPRTSGPPATTVRHDEQRVRPVTDPCSGLSAELVTQLVGFPVEGDGTATDNGAGFVSCQFKAPLDARPTAGSTVVVGSEKPETLDSIRTTLRTMASGREPTRVDLGDGGYLRSEPGFAEIRVITGDRQVEVNIITPMDRTIDLGPPTIAVAERVIANLS